MAIVMTLALIPIAMIDGETQLIPDSIVLPLMWIGLAMSLFSPMPGAQTLFISPQHAIIGAMAGYLSLWIVYQLFKLVTGKEGMGYGDFKLLAALGAWLGWQQLPLIVLMSAVGSSAARNVEQRIDRRRHPFDGLPQAWAQRADTVWPLPGRRRLDRDAVG